MSWTAPGAGADGCARCAVNVVLDERVALRGRSLDGIALSQEGINHVVDIPCCNSIDRLLPQMPDGDGQPPVQVDPTLIAGHPALATVVVTRGSDLEGVS
jgi:hypothetical protein